MPSIKTWSRSLREGNNLLLILNYIGLLIASNITIFITSIIIYGNIVQQGIYSNIHEYGEVDISHICDIYGCHYISKNGKLYENLHTKDLKKVSLKEIPFSDKPQELFTISETVINDDFSIQIKINDLHRNYSGEIFVNIMNIYDVLKDQLYIFAVLFISTNTLFLYIIFYNSFRSKYREESVREQQIYHSSLVILSENLHHELNTPLTVIDNKFLKLQKIFKKICNHYEFENLTKIDNEFRLIGNDFNLIETSLQQVNDILNRMREFKTLKHHFDDKPISDIIKTTLDVLRVTQSEKFEVDISEKLSKYKLNKKYLQDGELTGIILNHAKNSLDANCNNIHFIFNEFKNGTLKFYISDDGNGIPKHLKNKIFEKDESSKGNDRGNGLYINRFILETSKGKDELIFSDIQGTVFEITIKAEHV